MQSETFLPTIGQDSERRSGLLFVDIAGQDDRRGNLIEILNNFITKTLFNLAKSVRFMIVIDKHSLLGQRGA